MTESIAILALCVSLLLLVVQYTNQLERRHGEMVQLRSDLLTRFSVIQQRVTSNRMHAETARIDMRTMRDSDDKYDSIEGMPRLIAGFKEIEDKLRNVIGSINAIDTRRANRSKALLALQSSQNDVREVEDMTSALESDMLNLMENIRAHQSPRGKVAKE